MGTRFLSLLFGFFEDDDEFEFCLIKSDTRVDEDVKQLKKYEKKAIVWSLK